MNIKIQMLMTFIVMIVGAGCDVSNSLSNMNFLKKEEAEVDKEKKEADRAGESRIAALRESIKAKIIVEISTAETAIKLRRSAADDVRKDREALTARIRELGSATGVSRPSAFSAMLGDEKINKLATKYLFMDFTMAKLKFDSAVTESVDKTKKRNHEIASCRSDYERVKNEASGMSGEMNKASAKSLTSVKTELDKLEIRAKRLRKEISLMSKATSSRATFDIKRRELSRVEDEIHILRVQYDDYRGTSRSHIDLIDQKRKMDSAITTAYREYERQVDRIMKRYGKVKDVSSLLDEFDGITIAALVKTLADAEIKDREYVENAQRNIAYAKEMLNKVDTLGELSLKDIRADISKRFSTVK